MDVLVRAQNVAMGYLGRKMLTCRELYDRLCRKGFEKEVAQQVVERFVEVGYLDDYNYVRCYLLDGINIGAKGVFRIRRELMQKGISASIIDEVIESTPVETGNVLMEYVRGHNLLESIHTRKDLERVTARLVRRGYSLSEIRECFENAEFSLEEEELSD